MCVYVFKFVCDMCVCVFKFVCDMCVCVCVCVFVHAICIVDVCSKLCPYLVTTKTVSLCAMCVNTKYMPLHSVYHICR